jgi:threonine/homoserine/homoserine lactone efflux protein
MQDTFTTVTLLGIGIALSPVPILATIVLLSTREAGRNGLAYAFGFFTGLTILAMLVAWFMRQQGLSPRSTTSHLAVGGTLALGLLLIVFSSYQLTHHHRNMEVPPVPRWLRIVDRFRTPQSAGLGFFNSAFNAKNFALILVAASTVGQNALSTLETSIALGLLLIIAMLGIIAPLTIYFLGGRRSTALLERCKLWLIRNNATVIAVLFLFFGIVLVVKGVLKLNRLN